MTKGDLVEFLKKVDDSAEIKLVHGDRLVALEQVTLCATIDHPDIEDGGRLNPDEYKQGPTYVVLGKKKVV